MIDIKFNDEYSIAAHETVNYVQIERLVLDCNTWSHLTVRKQMSYGSF